MRAAAYLRVSSEDQADRGTIENQVEFALKYCDLHHIELIDLYKDDGVTGTIPLEERPEGKRLVEDARTGAFDLLLIYRIDRLGRSARIILNAVYDLEQCGVKIRSMTEPFDTGDPNGRFLLTVLAGVADLERETILERLWYGANRAARTGKWLGGIVPYGYYVNSEGFLEISEEKLPGLDLSEADVVRLIYRLIGDQGWSTIKVADYLNALGVPPSYAKDGRQIKKGKRKENTSGIWRPGRIRNMVVNSTYKGIHCYGKRTKKKRDIIPRAVPAIVSEDLWERAQRTLKNNQLESMRNAVRQYLLRGLIKCGLCGRTYQGNAYKTTGGKLKSYYVCGGKLAYNPDKCTAKNIPAEWIEDLVWHECVSFIRNPGDVLVELAETLSHQNDRSGELSVERETVQKAILEKDAEKQKILDLYRRGLISMSDVERQLQKITSEKSSLESRLVDIREQLDLSREASSHLASVEVLLSNLRNLVDNGLTFDIKREIVKLLVDGIVVDTSFDDKGRPHAVVTVRYVFSNGVTRTGKRAENTVDLSMARMADVPSRFPLL